MCQLTGMEVSNASMYDGASSLAEAVLMAQRITKRRKILLSQAIHPEYRRVIETYSDPDSQIVTIPYDKKTGQTDGKALSDLIDGEVGGVVLQSPNFFGVIEDLRPIAEKVHLSGGLLVAGFSEAVAYGILAPPGALGADIVAGEGQSLGIPVSFGGPYLGVFTTRDKFVRQMPGRLVGETVDLEGKRGFVLTLATREQHIRREKATSNICTNEGLCALMATVFLSTLGKEGLRELAMMNLSKAEYAKKVASQVRGCRIAFSSPTFNEFVLEIPEDPREGIECAEGREDRWRSSPREILSGIGPSPPGHGDGADDEGGDRPLGRGPRKARIVGRNCSLRSPDRQRRRVSDPESESKPVPKRKKDYADEMQNLRDTGLIQDEPLIFEQGSRGRKGYSLPHWDVEEAEAGQRDPAFPVEKRAERDSLS